MNFSTTQVAFKDSFFFSALIFRSSKKLPPSSDMLSVILNPGYTLESPWEFY